MSGIAGIVRHQPTGVSVDSLGRMAASIRHRGPDGYGFYVGQRVGFAHVRLGVVDIAGGAQPLTNEDGQIVVTYNGEIYNHPELRRELEQRGHIFRTRSDTEVLVHGYEEWGVNLLERLNGQFAFAIYDRNAETVFIARDRFGVRPLFYAQRKGALYFGSEIKAILASGEVDASLDRRGLDETFTFWAPRPPRTVFAGIASLEPGTYGILKDGALWLHRYYELDYPEAAAEPIDVVEQLDEIMLRSVGMRMRADVSVGAYVSGGLDSSITASLAASASPHALRSFSVTFADPQFDESSFQRDVAADVGSMHTITAISQDSIAESFPDVLWHTETPLLRTAPVPMYHLAKLTKDSGIKVVLTGDGADEIFLGNDVFKEVSVRRFCLRRPTSMGRQRLFDRLYPELMAQGRGGEFWRRFFLEAGAPNDPLFSHLPRFLLSARAKEFYSAEFKSGLGEIDVLGELRGSLPARFFGWSSLNQAAYLEMTTLLSPYVLSSHGDRMTMAHGVEGRFPFLDHRLFEFAAALPTGSRLRGLREKEILRRWASRILPPRIKERRKQPYRAPDAPSFFGPNAPEWVGDHLTSDALRRVGVFSPTSVEGLVRRCRAGLATGFRENQAIVGVLSTQLWHHQFLEHNGLPAPLPIRGASVMLTETAPALT
ncbi:MAG TPA: asparagine synthase (glutamine-hydrolyzing) [Gemmatimonadaceae bacterium]|jgi:asparagine synthase (glutamine-hydrolysing)|nr:asparagine synthase (glutamine-hydrolyzing) [Gemmatimonadaceae bacterium]